MINMYLVVEAVALSGRDGIAIKLQAVADKAAGDCEDEVIEVIKSSETIAPCLFEAAHARTHEMLNKIIQVCLNQF